MRLILTALLFAGGLIMLVLGGQFLIQPDSAAMGMGLSANGAAGLSSIRADLTGFFVVCGGCMLWGAWRRAGDLLLVPAALFGLAFLGRSVSAIADGTYDGFMLPMAFELVFAVLCVMGNRLLPHHKVEEIAG